MPTVRRWPFVVLAVLSALGIPYCLMGRVMAGSFTISNPEALAHWQRVAYADTVGTFVCFALFVGSCAVLWRLRSRRPAGDGAAAI